MGMSASQGRLLLLTARKSDLEFRAQQISQRRLILSQELEEISVDYEEATSNRQMKIGLFQVNAVDENGNKITKTSNLTYAALVSGSVNNSNSGIQASSAAGTAGQDYRSNTAYRLVDADGAVVVADESEIPDSVEVQVGQQSAEQQVSDKLNNSLSEIGSINYDYKNKTIKIGDSYYDVTTGKKITAKDYDANSAVAATVKEVKENDKLKNYKLTYNTPKTQIYRKEGADGKFSLVDSEGVVLTRYIVDKTLKYGSTDVNGDVSGPNYLQDCLRNGKYLIQKGGIDNDDQSFKWKSLSWESASNITDSYYTDDDDKAKAKYDRLQNQIQAQDKKLELELDNIETQRQAVTTEMESVQKVIDDNVQDSFKTFNA